MLKNVFDAFGAAIFVPIMLYIIALILKVPSKKAFNSALSAGVGLTGFSLITNSFIPIMVPIVDRMVKTTGIDLPILDIGWQATSVVAYSTQVGLVFIGIALLIQIVLFLLKWTNIFMPGDLWNNYSFMVWGSMLYLLTENMVLAIACMVVLNLYILLFAEVYEKRFSTYYNYPNCALTAPHHVGAVPYAIAMDWVLRKLGADKVNLNPATIKRRLGFIGDPVTLGLILGCLLGIAGNFDQLNRLEAWGQILTVGISTAAVMAIFPKVAVFFEASAFTSLTDASKKTAKGSSKKREWYIAVNDAVGYGEPATLITGILLIPIMVILAVILPGNKALPMVDLIALPYMVIVIISISKGNIFKALISGAIWFSLGLYMCTITAGYFTEVAMGVGIDIPAGVMMITSFGIMYNPFMAAIFLAFLSQNVLIITGVVVLYFVLYVLFRKNRTRVHDYLENAGETEQDVKPEVAL
ncbi:PTS galactitol transporter subunit IIC [Brevibacillus daliensis]|uniref:PTS galactitol transporter subunit IIC n=1 Tax=Brevibacillus daliensis TaxID=2892995 RepID=UPI001E58EBE5|nr:PTS transporter subunit IIC [Brevibacillus daliensis]